MPIKLGLGNRTLLPIYIYIYLLYHNIYYIYGAYVGNWTFRYPVARALRSHVGLFASYITSTMFRKASRGPTKGPEFSTSRVRAPSNPDHPALDPGNPTPKISTSSNTPGFGSVVFFLCRLYHFRTRVGVCWHFNPS